MNAISYAKKLLILLAVLLPAACQKEESKPSITFEGGADPALTFARTSGTQTIQFTSALDWTAKSSENWLVLDRTSGSGGKCTLKLTVSANEGYDSRKATITFISNSASTTLNKTITVTQDKKEAVETDKTAVNVSWEGGDVSIKVSANVEYTVSIDGDWISESSATKGLEVTTRVFGVDPSWSGKVRNGIISFKATGSSLEAKVKVTQDPNPNPSTGEDTPFTTKCSQIGAYSHTDSDAPTCTASYADYQYAFGYTSGRQFFRYVDFSKGEFTTLSITTASLTIGTRYNLVTSCSDNGNMVEKNSESMVLVSEKAGKIWLEDKTARTGYIIPTE